MCVETIIYKYQSTNVIFLKDNLIENSRPKVTYSFDAIIYTLRSQSCNTTRSGETSLNPEYRCLNNALECLSGSMPPSAILALPPTPNIFPQYQEASTDRTRSFSSLQPRTRLYIGLGTMAWAGLGLLLSDKAEEVFGLKPTEKDRQALEDVLPRVRRID